MNILDAHFPTSSRMGCVGAWTPFFTERPFTLFLNKEMYSDGMVGLARYSPNLPPPKLSVSGLTPLGSEMTITK